MDHFLFSLTIDSAFQFSKDITTTFCSINCLIIGSIFWQERVIKKLSKSSISPEILLLPKRRVIESLIEVFPSNCETRLADASGLLKSFILKAGFFYASNKRSIRFFLHSKNIPLKNYIKLKYIKVKTDETRHQALSSQLGSLIDDQSATV
jgi:hypothetical protein